MSELTERLQSTKRRIQRILTNPLCSDLIQNELSIKIYERPDGSTHREVTKFSQTQIDAFILNYRLLVQDKDQISFRQIRASLKKATSLQEALPDIADDIEKTSDSFNHFLNSASGLKEKEKDLTKRGILDAFLYGYYSHESKTKRKALERWSKEHEFEMLHLAFIDILKRIVGYLIIFESIFSTALAFLQVEDFEKIYPPKKKIEPDASGQRR